MRTELQETIGCIRLAFEYGETERASRCIREFVGSLPPHIACEIQALAVYVESAIVDAESALEPILSQNPDEVFSDPVLLSRHLKQSNWAIEEATARQPECYAAWLITLCTSARTEAERETATALLRFDPGEFDVAKPVDDSCQEYKFERPESVRRCREREIVNLCARLGEAAELEVHLQGSSGDESVMTDKEKEGSSDDQPLADSVKSDDSWPRNWKSQGIQDEIPEHPLELQQDDAYADPKNLKRDRFLFWKRQVMEDRDWTESEICEAAYRRWKLGRENTKDKRKTARTAAKRYGDWIGIASKKHK